MALKGFNGRDGWLGLFILGLILGPLVGFSELGAALHDAEKNGGVLERCLSFVCC